MILNSASKGYHIGLLCLIYRALRANAGPISYDKLIQFSVPSSLAEKENQKIKFMETLDFWADESHCLWIKDTELNFSLKYETPTTDPEPFEIAKLVRDILFSCEIPDITIPKKNNKFDIEPLLLIATCLMLVSDYLPEKKHMGRSGVSVKASLDQIVTKYLNAADHLLNGEERAVVDWLLFLGCIEIHGEDYFTDPTRLVKDCIKETIEPNEKLSVKEFLKRLAARLPLLEGGKYYKQVSEYIDPELLEYQVNQRVVSPVMSHAVRRLETDQFIFLNRIADDPHAMKLTNGTREISTITLNGDYAGV